MDLSGWGMEAEIESELCRVEQILIPVAYTGRTKTWEGRYR